MEVLRFRGGFLKHPVDLTNTVNIWVTTRVSNMPIVFAQPAGTASGGWDLSTFSYDSVTYDAPGGTFVYGMAANPDGSALFTANQQGHTINVTSMSSAWDLSTGGSGGGAYLAPTVQNLTAVAFNAAGTRMYVGNALGRIYQYNLSVAWDVSTRSLIGNVIPSQGTAYCIRVSADGTKMYCGNGSTIFQYTMPTPNEITGLSYDSVSAAPSNGGYFDFKPDGTQVFVTGTASDTVAQHDLGTAWDLSTFNATVVSSVSTSPNADPTGLVFKPDGTRFMVLDVTTPHNIFQFSG